MNEIIELHRQCLTAVIVEDYYVHVLAKLCKHLPHPELITDPDKICTFWNDFWEQLPDSPSIRRGPFFKVCDLAEGGYLEDLIV
jgi:hypothetical protein